MIIFLHPEYLFFLLLVPIIVLIHLTSLRAAKRRAIKFVNFDAIRRIKGVELYSKNLTLLYLNIAIVTLVVLALSGISFTYVADSSKNSFALVIDSSRSMGANDILPTRFDAAKKAGEDFLQMVPPQTRIGIISFSSSTIIESEVTDQSADLQSAIKMMNLMPSGGTDILTALVTASNILRLEQAKTIILISDGNTNVQSAQEIVDYAAKNNIMIYTLGVGTAHGGTDSSGGVYGISEDFLKILAENTGGKYYPISKVEDFYSSLTNIVDTAKKNILINLTNYLLILSVFLMVVNFFAINNKYRTFP